MTSDRAFTCMFSFRIFFQEWTILNLVDVPLPGNKLNSPSLAYIGASISCLFFLFCCCWGFAVLVWFLCRFWNSRDRSRTTARWSSKSPVLRQNSRMSTDVTSALALWICCLFLRRRTCGDGRLGIAFFVMAGSGWNSNPLWMQDDHMRQARDTWDIHDLDSGDCKMKDCTLDKPKSWNFKVWLPWGGSHSSSSRMPEVV